MKYYFVAIKGAGMSSLATILYDLGNEVSGCDRNTAYTFTCDNLYKRNIRIDSQESYDFNEEYIVIHSAAVKKDSDVLTHAYNIGCEVYSYPEFMGKFTNEYKTICVSGCHGKTTTTTILSTIFKNTVGCNYLIGDSNAGADSNSDYFILEACEYRRHFLNYHPYSTIITNIELDHTDYFKDIDDCISAYNDFVNITSNNVLCCGDDLNCRKLKTTKKIYFYGLNDNNDFVAKNIIKNSNGYSFDLYFEGSKLDNFNVQVFGEHMLLNIIGSISLSYLENISIPDIKNALVNLEPAKRRFNIEVINGFTLIDDYGHHPTEIKATIDSVKQKYVDKKINVIFECHTYTRAKDLKDEFIKVLSTVDKAYIMDIYNGSREENSDNLDYTIFTNNIDNSEHISLDTINKLSNHKDEVIILFSARDNDILNKFKEELKKG